MAGRSPLSRYIWLAALPLLASCGRPSAAPAGHTRVVMLGTGTPRLDPERSGPAVAVVVNGAVYLVDAGPGVVRRAAAARAAGQAEFTPQALNRVFITHLHSDHTLGLPDVLLSPWVMGRHQPLDVYGPPGIQAMMDNITAAWSKDIDVRTQGLEQQDGSGDRATVHEIAAGEVYRDGNVRVQAFAVHHGSWDYAFGYRFQTADRVIVFSGDTTPVAAVAEACAGFDVLFHEVYDPNGIGSEAAYFQAFHTSPAELGKIATAAHPKLLVLYHQIMNNGDEAALLREVRDAYKGPVVSAKDLGVY